MGNFRFIGTCNPRAAARVKSAVFLPVGLMGAEAVAGAAGVAAGSIPARGIPSDGVS